eukprot:7391539-Prymnesium_polylepis.2
MSASVTAPLAVTCSGLKKRVIFIRASCAPRLPSIEVSKYAAAGETTARARASSTSMSVRSELASRCVSEAVDTATAESVGDAAPHRSSVLGLAAGVELRIACVVTAELPLDPDLLLALLLVRPACWLPGVAWLRRNTIVRPVPEGGVDRKVDRLEHRGSERDEDLEHGGVWLSRSRGGDRLEESGSRGTVGNSQLLQLGGELSGDGILDRLAHVHDSVVARDVFERVALESSVARLEGLARANHDGELEEEELDLGRVEEERTHLGRCLLADALLNHLVRPSEQLAVERVGQQRQLLHVVGGEPACLGLLLGGVASDLSEDNDRIV